MDGFVAVVDNYLDLLQDYCQLNSKIDGPIGQGGQRQVVILAQDQIEVVLMVFHSRRIAILLGPRQQEQFEHLGVVDEVV